MSSTQSDPGETDDTAVAERRRVMREVRGWLLMAAEDPTRAKKEWDKVKVALLACGRTFSVVKMQPHVVWAAAGTEDRLKVDAYLALELGGGPVFMTLHPDRYYALVPVEAGERYEWKGQGPRGDARFLGQGAFVTVPTPELVRLDGARAYWSVPLRGDGSLCTADSVSRLLEYGRYNLALKGAAR